MMVFCFLSISSSYIAKKVRQLSQELSSIAANSELDLSFQEKSASAFWLPLAGPVGCAGPAQGLAPAWRQKGPPEGRSLPFAQAKVPANGAVCLPPQAEACELKSLRAPWTVYRAQTSRALAPDLPPDHTPHSSCHPGKTSPADISPKAAVPASSPAWRLPRAAGKLPPQNPPDCPPLSPTALGVSGVSGVRDVGTTQLWGGRGSRGAWGDHTLNTVF